MRILRLLALVAPLACADYEGLVTPAAPDAEVLDARFSRDVFPIVERRCGIGGCHSARTHQAELYLTADSAYAALVNRPSRLYAGEVFVRPGNADDSWMVIALRGDAARRRGLARMPLGSGALTDNQVRTIVNWINRGAPND